MPQGRIINANRKDLANDFGEFKRLWKIKNLPRNWKILELVTKSVYALKYDECNTQI